MALRKKQPLDRDRIAEAALALADKEGLEALTMRRLGEALGVEAMALYHHFPAKADLLDAVAELLVVKMGVPDGASWQDKIRSTARRYRQIAIAHPQAFGLLSARRAATPRAFAVYEAILATFREAGFEGETMAKAFRLLGYYIGGAGDAEVATRLSALGGAGGPPDPAQFPLMAAAGPFLTAGRLESVFEFGLDALIGALERTPRRAV